MTINPIVINPNMIIESATSMTNLLPGGSSAHPTDRLEYQDAAASHQGLGRDEEDPLRVFDTYAISMSITRS